MIYLLWFAWAVVSLVGYYLFSEVMLFIGSLDERRATNHEGKILLFRISHRGVPRGGYLDERPYKKVAQARKEYVEARVRMAERLGSVEGVVLGALILSGSALAIIALGDIADWSLQWVAAMEGYR